MVGCDGRRPPSNRIPRGATCRSLAFFGCCFSSPAIALALLAGLGAEETPRQRLDAAHATLGDIDAALKADNLTDADLARLRAESDSLAAAAAGRDRRTEPETGRLGETAGRTDPENQGKHGGQRRDEPRS